MASVEEQISLLYLIARIERCMAEQPDGGWEYLRQLLCHAPRKAQATVWNLIGLVMVANHPGVAANLPPNLRTGRWGDESPC